MGPKSKYCLALVTLSLRPLAPSEFSKRKWAKHTEVESKSVFTFETEKSRNGDTLGPVELNVWLEQGDQGDQGDRREQDDKGDVSIIIFGMSESSGFQNIA